jgi:hypothetical protein
MGPPLPDVGVQVREESRTQFSDSGFMAVQYFAFLIGEAGPMGDTGFEGMREVDELFGLENLVDLKEGEVFGRMADDGEAESKCANDQRRF